MFPTLLLFFLQTNLLLFLSQSICLDNGIYTANSTYSNNLNTALSSLPSNIGANGFYNASVGSQGPDTANAIAFCRGDLELATCQGCVRDLAATLLASCPTQRQAIDWTGLCMVRYSNDTIVGALATSPRHYERNKQNATSPDQFMATVRTLLDSIRAQAAAGGPLKKVAARNATAPDSGYIYGMVQCTPDLSPQDCSSCLTEAADSLPECCNRSVGARINFPSCTLLYEIFHFYNEDRLPELAAAPLGPPSDPSLAPAPPSPSPPAGRNGGNDATRNVVIIIVVSVAACVILIVSVCILLRRRMKRKREETRHATDDTISTVESLKYELSTLRAATNDFSDDNKLGQGGFGVVYKGVLSNGQEIAVKRLSQNSGQGDMEFKNEVMLLAKLQHRNLVGLLGFCLEGTEKLLIYEFVLNASLDKFIFDPIKSSHLDWEKRYRIICGIARGILYLHEDSRLKIIHRDLKPSNVLLDGVMNPKIADFGMARLFRQDETQGNTNRIAGTFGYMAPEYALHGLFSVKSDVFSFGVLVLEIISGQKNNNIRLGENVDDLLSFAWKMWRENTAANMVDPCLRSGSGSSSISVIMRCIQIGLLCVQEDASDRPRMASVVLMLNSFSIPLAIPSAPAFYVPSDYGSDTSLLQEYKSTTPLSDNNTTSRSEASITE